MPDIFGKPFQMSIDERRSWVKSTLKQLIKPQPSSLAKISLEGMENEKKAEKILEALKQYEEYRRREQEWSPSVCQSEELSEHKMGTALIDFFQNEGSFLTESYCVLRFGQEKKSEHFLYCGIYPYVFKLKEYSPDYESSYQFRQEELLRKVKEKHQIVGNFGLVDANVFKEGFESSPFAIEGFKPSPFAIGEGGTYYNFDAIQMYRTNNLSALLARMFDFTDVTEVEVYKGCLGFSQLDKKIEYCFGEEDLRKSMYSTEITVADMFVRFTRAERMSEFARWVNGIISHVDSLNLPFFWQRNRGIKFIFFLCMTEEKNIVRMS